MAVPKLTQWQVNVGAPSVSVFPFHSPVAEQEGEAEARVAELPVTPVCHQGAEGGS